MSKSKRMDKPRCTNCKGKKGNPVPVSVRSTANDDYVILRCACGHEYKTNSAAAFRLAVQYGIADYGRKHLGRDVLFAIRFDEKGDFKSTWAAEGWLHKKGYSSGSTGLGNDPVALRIGKYDLPQKWHNINDAGRASVDGVMYCQREGPARVFLFTLSNQMI